MKLLLFIVGLTLVASGPSFRTLVDSTTTTTATTTTSNYTALTQAQIKSSAEVQGALKYGANKIIQDGYTKGKIPQSTYSITKVVSVGKQVVNSGRNAYQCQVELQGTNKVIVDAQFVVSVNVSTKVYSLGTYSYSVSNLGNTNTTSNYTALTQAQIKNSTEVQGALKYGANRTLQDGYTKGTIPKSTYSISKVVSVGKQVTAGRNAYQCQIELQGTNKAIVDAQFVVYYNVSTKAYSLGTYSYNVSNLANTTTPNNTTNTTSNYTLLTQAQINSSAEVQSVLNYGVNQTLQDGYTKGKIPVSTYSISQVVSVGKQTLSNGRNAYQCQIQLQGVNGVVVNSQFVVYVTVSTGALSLNSLAYQIPSLGNTKTL